MSDATEPKCPECQHDVDWHTINLAEGCLRYGNAQLGRCRCFWRPVAATHRCATFEVPLRTRSPNRKEHWGARQRRVKKEREAVASGFPWQFKGLRGDQLTITVTRVAPRQLDAHDNLRASLKGCVDEISSLLGFDKADNDPRLTWRYAQERGKYAVRVTIEALTIDKDAA